MVLLTDGSVKAFAREDAFSLGAESGLVMINGSAYVGEQSGSESDMVMWSDLEGLMAEAAVELSGISFDEEENFEYYERRSVRPKFWLERSILRVMNRIRVHCSTHPIAN